MAIAWATHRDASPTHNVPYGQQIFEAGWRAALARNPQPDDGHEHDFVDTCIYCGQDAHDYFNPREEQS